MKLNQDKIAFFDFDGTLIHSDSFISFSKFAVGNTRFTLACVESLPWLILWKLGIKSGGWAKEHLFGRLFKGMSADKWGEKCHEFALTIDSDLRTDIVDKLKQHQAKGHQTVIVTASPVDWVRPWAVKMGVSQLIGTEIEIDSTGHLTGRFASPNCHGKEKARRVSELWPHLDEAESWGYGDSKSDEYLLVLTSYPTKV